MASGECEEAILLVGGRGTRLRPLTLRTPKPMLPTAGVPLVMHQLARLASAGLRRVVLATSYRPDIFADYFGGGSVCGVELDWITEEEPLGTGGGIRNAAAQLASAPDQPVLVLNGDVLSGHDLAAQIALHHSSAAAATLHLTEVADPTPFGCVPTDEQGRVLAFHEKLPEPTTNRVNAGAYVLTREVIDRITEGVNLSVERDVFPALLEAGEVVMGYAEPAYWLDVGTPEAYVRGSCDLVLGRLASAALPGPPSQAQVCDVAGVAPDAVVDGGAAVGSGGLVGPGAEVSGSVLFDDVLIGEGAVVRGCALAAGVRVGTGAVLDGVVAADGVVIGPGNELRAGLRLWPDVELPPGAIRFSSDG